MKLLYLILLIGTLFFPVILSFEKHVAYRKSWKSALLSAIVIAIPFLLWDYFFTLKGIWGFNPDYISGIYLFNLPLEEILFFIAVPFACTFIYEVCKYYFRNYTLHTFNKVFSFIIPLYAIVLTLIGTVGYYTLSVILSSTIILIWMLLKRDLRYLGISFVFSLLPFLVVNGILTGSGIEQPVVWYSEVHKIDTRIFSIPMEDVLYSFTLVVSNMLLFERFQSKFSS